MTAMNHLPHHQKELTQYLRQQALALGFEAVGIARAEELSDEAHKLEQWLNRGLHGTMGYMANYFEQSGPGHTSSHTNNGSHHKRGNDMTDHSGRLN